MEINKIIKYFLGIVILGCLIFFAYKYLPVLFPGDQEDINSDKRDVLSIKEQEQEIEELKSFDTDIFDDPKFRKLKDNTRAAKERIIPGKVNIFEP